MKKIIGIVLLLAIILTVLFLPIFPVSVEKLPTETLLQFHRVGGIAGFVDDLTINSDGVVYKFSKQSSVLTKEELKNLNDYISGPNSKYVRESIFNKIKGMTNKEIPSYPDRLSQSVRVNTNGNTYEIYENKLLFDLIGKFL